MKAFRLLMISMASGLGLVTAALSQPANPTETKPAPAEVVVEPAIPHDEERVVAPDEAGGEDAPEPADAPEFHPDDNAVREPAAKAPEPLRSRETSRETSRGTRPSQTLPAPQPSGSRRGDRSDASLHLNFRGVPLDMVLNYLSDAAGFIINLEADVQGRVDVWSNQPLTRDEAVDLLNSVLRKNGYAALRNGRTLTIVNRDDAKRRDVPVISGNIADDIPRSDAIVTQIIPVKFISATQLVKDLQPLLPTSTELSANEGGNALVLTDTQVNIRRMVEIVQALDQAVNSISKVQVFQLQYADSKALATIIQNLFQTQDTSRGGNNQGGGGRFFAQFRGGQGNNAAPGDGASANGGRAPVPRVVAVADERSNSVIVSAPEDQMAVIAGIVQDVDTNVDDITELRVFRLKNADPQETADMLTSLFEDSSTSRQGNNNRQGTQFRFGGGQGRGGNGGNNTAASERMVKETRVVAVPDLRTRSVVVSAARNLIDQIGLIVKQLDDDPARKQKVYVYSVENTDPQAVQEVIQNLFPEQNTSQLRNNRNSQQQNASQLNNRQTQTRNQTGRTSNTGFGTTNPFGGNNGGN